MLFEDEEREGVRSLDILILVVVGMLGNWIMLLWVVVAFSAVFIMRLPFGLFYFDG